MVCGGRVARASFSLTSSAGMGYACKVRKDAHVRGFHTDLGGGRLTHASFSFTSSAGMAHSCKDDTPSLRYKGLDVLERDDNDVRRQVGACQLQLHFQLQGWIAQQPSIRRLHVHADGTCKAKFHSLHLLRDSVSKQGVKCGATAPQPSFKVEG